MAQKIDNILIDNTNGDVLCKNIRYDNIEYFLKSNKVKILNIIRLDDNYICIFYKK